MTEDPPDVPVPPDPTPPDPTLPDPTDPLIGDFTADRVEEQAARAAAEHRAGGPAFQWPLVVVLLGLLGSLIWVASDHFRRGSVLFAAFVVGAFFLRLILSDREAGWLAVRSRGIDLICLAFLGVSLSVFSLIVPPPS